MKLADLLDLCGVAYAFEMRTSVLDDGWFMPVAIDAAIRTLPGRTEDFDAAYVEDPREQIQALGRFGAEAELPWLSRRHSGVYIAAPWLSMRDSRRGVFSELDDLERFGIFLVMATWVELGNEESGETVSGARVAAVQRLGAGAPMWHDLSDLLTLATEQDLSPEDAFLDDHIRRVVQMWARGEIDLVGASDGDPASPTGP